MVKTETIQILNKDYLCTYSDGGKYVVRDEIFYERAVDPIDSARTYSESAEDIPKSEDLEYQEL